VQADKPAAFLVRKNGAKGELDAKVHVMLWTCEYGSFMIDYIFIYQKT
jgi:hypothetical protein